MTNYSLRDHIYIYNQYRFSSKIANYKDTLLASYLRLIQPSLCHVTPHFHKHSHSYTQQDVQTFFHLELNVHGASMAIISYLPTSLPIKVQLTL